MQVRVGEDVGCENLGKLKCAGSFIASWVRGAGHFSLTALGCRRAIHVT